MLFSKPDGLKTWEKILEIAVSGMRPESRARLEAEVQALGRFVQEVVEATLTRHYEDWVEPPDSEWSRRVQEREEWPG